MENPTTVTIADIDYDYEDLSDQVKIFIARVQELSTKLVVAERKAAELNAIISVYNDAIVKEVTTEAEEQFE